MAIDTVKFGPKAEPRSEILVPHLAEWNSILDDTFIVLKDARRGSWNIGGNHFVNAEHTVAWSREEIAHGNVDAALLLYNLYWATEITHAADRVSTGADHVEPHVLRGRIHNLVSTLTGFAASEDRHDIGWNT